MTCINLLRLKPRRRYRVTHRAAHHAEPCEICGIVKVLRSQNVRDDDVVENAGDGIARVEWVRRGCCGRSISIMCSVGGHRWRAAGGARLVVAAFPRTLRHIHHYQKTFWQNGQNFAKTCPIRRDNAMIIRNINVHRAVMYCSVAIRST